MALTPATLLGGWYPDDTAPSNPWNGSDDVTGIPGFTLAFPIGWGIETSGPYFNVSDYALWRRTAGDASVFDYMYIASDIGLDDMFEIRAKTIGGGLTFDATQPKFGIMLWAEGGAGYVLYIERQATALFDFKFAYYDGAGTFSEVVTLEAGLPWHFATSPNERYLDMGVRVYGGIVYPWRTAAYTDLTPERNARLEYGGIVPAQDFRNLEAARTSHGLWAFTKFYNGAPASAAVEFWHEPPWSVTELVAQDTFTDTDGVELDDHTPELGFSSWVVDAPAETAIQFNHMDVLASGSSTKAVCSADIPLPGFRVSLDVYGRDSAGTAGTEMGGFTFYTDDGDYSGYAIVITADGSNWTIDYGLWDGTGWARSTNLAERRVLGLVPWTAQANGVRIGAEVTDRYVRCYYEPIGGGTRRYLSEPLYMATDRTSNARFGLVLGGGHQFDNFEVRELEDDTPLDPGEFIPGPVFPFDHDWDAPLSEGWEYATDIIESDDGHEQRRKIRPIPRRLMEMQVNAQGDRAVAMLTDFMATQLGGHWRVPFWPEGRWVRDIIGPETSNPFLELAAPWLGTDAAAECLLWKSPWQWQIVNLASIGHGSVESVSIDAAIEFDYAKPLWIAPLREAYCVDRQSVDRRARGSAVATITFVFP